MIGPLLLFIVGAFAGGVVGGLVIECYGRSQAKNRLKAAREELIIEHERNLQEIRGRLTEQLNGQQGLLAAREDELKVVRSQLSKLTTQHSRLQEKNAALSENTSQIRQQLSYQQQENQRIKTEYETNLIYQKDRYAKLKSEHDHTEREYREKVSLALQKGEELEARRTQVKEQADLLQAQEKELTAQKEDYAKLKSDYERTKRDYRENVSLALEESEALEERNAQVKEYDALLQARNEELIAKNQALESDISRILAERKQLSIQHRQEIVNLSAAQHTASPQEVTGDPLKETLSDINFGQLIQALFPGIKLLRDSADEIARHPKEAGEILCRLLAFENNNFEYSKKVQGTGGYWSECRAPHLNMIRLYYRKKQKSPGGKCEILISYKKDRKTQEKDIAWLQNQAKKR